MYKIEHLLHQVRHKTGHLATKKQIAAMVDLASATKMDESWFGNVVEAENQNGDLVHVVWDRERRDWLTLKYAVKLLDEGVGHVRDYLDLEGAVEFEWLMRKVGLITPKMEKEWFWTGRFVSKSRRELCCLMDAVMAYDSMWDRFRPMTVIRRRKSNLYFLDLGDNLDWIHSTERWFCGRDDVKGKIAYEIWGYRGLTGNDKYYHHLSNGKEMIVGEVRKDMPNGPRSPEDIVEDSMYGK